MDQDIIQMFREKNRLILVNNLNFDIEKNIDSLSDTIVNIFNNDFQIASKNISMIFTDSFIEEKEKKITLVLEQLRSESYQLINEAIRSKKKILMSAVEQLDFEEDSMNQYYELVFTTTNDIQEVFQNKSMNHIQQCSNKKLNSLIEKNAIMEEIELATKRISGYLESRLFGKLEDKFSSEIAIRDNNLINKAKESYLKYQDISLKTTQS